MDHPQSYSENNDFAVQGTSSFLVNHLHLIKWKNDARILDIGSGDGAVLMKVLLPKLPKDFREVVATDISKEMVEFAKENYPNKRVRFVKMDIATKNIPDDFQEKFDHVFSFYCLHWVPEQKQCIRNIYHMLKPGGDILLLILTFNPVFGSYVQMAKTAKWAPHMKNWESAVSPYMDSLDPYKEFEKILKEQGFENITVKREIIDYTFANFAAYQDFFLSVNPFVLKLPSSMVNEYIEDLSETIKKNEYVTIETSKSGSREEKVHHRYGILSAYASKPL